MGQPEGHAYGFCIFHKFVYFFVLSEVRKLALKLENQHPCSCSLFSSNNQEYMQLEVGPGAIK